MTFSVALIALATLAAAPSAFAASSPATSAPSTRPTIPGASGSVAAVTGSSMEVQNPETGQVTVSWTPSTTFTQTVTSTVSDVAVGDCVTVTGKPASKNSTKGPIAGTSVIVVQPSAGGICATTASGFGAGGPGAAFGRGNGSFRPTAGGTFPNGGSFPTRGSFPSGAARNFANFAFATGKVTQISSGSFTVEGVMRSGGATSTKSTSKPKSKSKGKSKSKSKSKNKSAASTPAKPATSSTEAIDVTTGSSTTYSQTSTTSSSSLAIGQCVTARGPASDTGAIAATSISVRSPGASGCTAGFGGFGGFGGGAPGSAG